jgi:type VI secretion system secreted protein VgrG
MADFQICYEWMMNFEDPTRAYAQVPDAPPGAFAISGVNSAAWPEQFAQIAAIAQNERGAAVEAFYEANFWDSWLEQIQSPEIAKRVFDTGVNAGRGTAAKILQEAVNVVLIHPPFIAEDGLWGPATVAAVNAADPVALQTAFIEGRCARYNEIEQNNPADEKYLAGWLARAQA